MADQSSVATDGGYNDWVLCADITRCLLMVSLHYVTIDDVKRP